MAESKLPLPKEGDNGIDPPLLLVLDKIAGWTCCPSENGKGRPPPVKLVKLPEKGFGLAASCWIQQGQVVFTEQVPTQAVIPMPSRETFTITSHCENCLCSMEPASTYFDTNDLPLAHLWPIPEYNSPFQQVFNDNEVPGLVDEESNTPMGHNGSGATAQFIKDDQDRIICQHCTTLFCSTACHKSFFANILPDCCLYQQLKEVLWNVVASHYSDRNDTMPTSLADHWEVLLAVRLMCAQLTDLRQQNGDGITNTTSQSSFPLAEAMQSMCGEPSELTKLQVGLLSTGTRTKDTIQQQSSNKSARTVEPFYQAICQNLEMTNREKRVLSLQVFERLVIVCSRNSLHVMASSPFATYEERVTQQFTTTADSTTSSSDTNNLINIKHQIARAIGKSMFAVDDPNNEYGAVQCCAILPLFARINHSCDPNLQVQDKEVVVMEGGEAPSSRRRLAIELIAARDIGPGEELSVCYLSPHAVALEEPQRNQRLQTRYLFTCHCSRCAKEQHQEQ